MIGHGDAFVMRDPAGIRPAYYYRDDEVVVVASERPVIQTAFNLKTDQIQEIKPGHALIVRKSGDVSEEMINQPTEQKSCSFERIYFSRGNDEEIYKERMELGRQLVPKVLKAINYDIQNTVFSYIPNTAEMAFYGLTQGMNTWMNHQKAKEIAELGEKADPKEVAAILNRQIRTEKVAIKDVKLRTFITEDSSRDDLVAHVYDISYGTVTSTDNLVVLDDSIVRGTTLRNSIIRMLDRLNPKRIIVVSSAPQIRYPDCYGIDMAKMGDFIAFQAAIALHKEQGNEAFLKELKKKAQKEIAKPLTADVQNVVKEVYEPFTNKEISKQIAKLITTDDVRAEVKVIYQNVEAVHEACPKNLGDWYFTGDYPSPGGMRVVNQAFLNYMDGRNKRAY
jgi:amidophosphoribosyltransferase